MAEAMPHEFGDRLAVVLDLKNPLCYLALAPTFALADERAIDVDWLPMEHSGSPPPPEPSGDRGSEHRRFRALYRERDLARYARVQGLELRNLYRATDSSHAGMGMLAASAHSPATLRRYLPRVCERHWNESLDIENADAIEKLLEECGVSAASLSAHRDEYRTLQPRLRAAGLFTTPAYVVAGQVFYGRAHLPMIRQILTDRAGARPD